MPSGVDRGKRRDFVTYVVLTLFSKIGDKTYIIGMPWLVYNLTGSALGMGVMFLVETLPYIFISPLAGMLTDRISRKFLLIFTSAMQATCIGTVLLLNALSLLHIQYVYMIGFILACASATYIVLNDTIVPELFQQEMLVKANSINQFIETSTLLLGTSIAGVLIGFIGVFGLLAMVSLSYLCVSVVAIFLSLPSGTPAQKKQVQTNTIIQTFKEGFSYVVKHPIISRVAFLNLLANIAVASITALLVYFTRDNLKLSSVQVGLIYGLAACAEIVGILLVPLFTHKRLSFIKVMLCCQFVFACGVIWTAFSWSMITVAMGMMLQNISIVLYNVFSRSLRQQVVPSRMLGRVNGIFLMLGQTAYPLAGFFSALLSNFFGVRWIFSMVGVFTLIVAVIYWLSPFRRMRVEQEVEVQAETPPLELSSLTEEAIR